MKTDTIDQQPGVAIQPSTPSPLPSLLNAPNPADTALIPSDVGSVSSPGALSATPLAQASILSPQLTKKPRNGKIARLPKPIREVVNRMLFNHVPQENIVAALEEIGIKVTQRNISNWKTRGGYREWCLAQEHAIQLHNHQDNLVDLLRCHDASELSEVGLQAAATQLSEFFLTPEARQLLASNPKEYERRVSMLTSISARLKGQQKYRHDCARNLGYKHDPTRIRRDTAGELEKLRQDWSLDAGNSPKDAPKPHRNELPKHGELFHLVPPDPRPLFLTFQDFLEACRRKEAKAAATPETTDAAASTRGGSSPALATTPKK